MKFAAEAKVTTALNYIPPLSKDIQECTGEQKHFRKVHPEAILQPR